MPRKIAVVGSLNMDLVTRVAVAPGPGVTVTGSDLVEHAGGKGLNQAGAAGRLGRHTKTLMVGRVGDDEFGRRLCASLAASGVDVRAVLPTQGRPSGVALILVEGNGQNRIVVTPGANDALRPEDVERALGSLDEPPAVLLLQLESPHSAALAAASHARRHGATVVLDPAPAPASVPRALLRVVDVLTPNESEALALLGEPGYDVSLGDAPRVVERLRQKTGVGTVVLKLGAKGAWVGSDGSSRHVPAPAVAAIDTTAAGDTFNGALAVMLAETRALAAPVAERDLGLAAAAAFANCAAAISVTREGALASVPHRDEVESLWRQAGPLAPPPAG